MELTVREIARSLGGDVLGDDRVLITGINAIDGAGMGDISFFFDKRYRGQVKKTGASALLVRERVNDFAGPQILVRDPRLAQAKIAAIFAPPPPEFSGISPVAAISQSASIGDDATIYPNVYVGEDVLIGDRVVLYPGVFLGDRVRIGDGTTVYSNVSILHDCIVGRDVIIHAGSVIGSDGFGFVKEGSHYTKVPQLGIVRIDDRVEIGAGNCIDRATFGTTWIQEGVKTDNLIHIAHNVVIGENSVIAAQTGISGSVEIGSGVVMGGQVGIADHLKIGNGAMIGPGTGIYKSVPPGDVISGSPAMPHRLFLKVSRLLVRLPSMLERLRELEKRVKSIEDDQDEK